MAQASIDFKDWGQAMHFRPAAEIVEIAKSYEVPIYLQASGDDPVLADSIMNLMTLTTGTQMKVISESEAAVAEIIEILAEIQRRSHP